jgi:hypothetical protein
MTKTATTAPAQPARAFTPNSWYEALLAERDTDRARFELRYSPATLAAVAAYEQAQAKAQQHAQPLSAGRDGA